MKNELVIFWNHGIEKIKVVNFFLILSFFVLLFQTILLTIIVPKSQEIAKDQIRTSSVDYFEGLIKPQKFNDTVAIFVKDTFYYEGDLNYFFQDPNAEIVAEYTEKDRQFFEAERKAGKSG